MSETRIPKTESTGLFTVAYELLGSAADAEDVVQQTWLQRVDGALGIRTEENGTALAVAGVRVDAGRVAGLYGVTDPQKLTRLDRETQLVT